MLMTRHTTVVIFINTFGTYNSMIYKPLDIEWLSGNSE